MLCNLFQYLKKGANLVFSNAGKFVLKNYTLENITHPIEMTKETNKFLTRWLYNKNEQPSPNALSFEPHSHSHFSDGEELSTIVNTLFEKNIKIWALTDHNNSQGFDSLIKGTYKLPKNYELDINPDKRSLLIHNVTDKNKEPIRLLRSIELYTNKGEINIHGYEGKEPKEKITIKDAANFTKDRGGFFIINHPYAFIGLGYHGNETIEEAIQLGASAIEINGTEIPPEIFSPVRTRRISKKNNIPIITSGDAHKTFMYGLSGITFQKQTYQNELATNKNHINTIKNLIETNQFDMYLNYLTPLEFKKFFSFEGYANAKIPEK